MPAPDEHVHFHVCVVDGVFEEVAGDVIADVQPTPPSVIFHPASEIDETVVAQVQATLRRRILRAFVGRGLLQSRDAKDMLAYQHSGFSVDTGVCIEAHDRAALERLLRYCARPPFAMERLRKEGAALVYRCAKQRSEPSSDRRGAKVNELNLTPLELIDRIAAARAWACLGWCRRATPSHPPLNQQRHPSSRRHTTCGRC